MRVMFTGGGGAGTEALWDLLGGRHDLHFADADKGRVNPGVPAGHAHEIPYASDPTFMESLRDLCERLNVEVLIPGVDEELEQLALSRSLFGSTTVLLPDIEYVQTMLDKFEFARSLSQIGVPVPRTQLLGDSSPWTLFPCIVKPRKGRGSRGVTVVENPERLTSLTSLAGIGMNDFVVQELAGGIEYSVQMFADEGAVLRAVFPARIIAKRGITISAIGDLNTHVIEACAKIHQALPARGVYNVQGILTGDLRFMPFEINPRVSTTLCLAVASGLDPLELFYSTGQHQGLVPFGAGVALDRFWHNSFTHPFTNQ